ncbi:MAG: cobalt-precorrin-5B (C(1))-methyltransferase CbiD [Bacillota bacterium]
MEKGRRGYTTGTCAAAAAKAAALMLFSGIEVPHVQVRTLTGEEVILQVAEHRREPAAASCAVIKDAGDDPDITHGMAVWARVVVAGRGVAILGGEGVGVVTKPGLAAKLGEPAINPGPCRMIRKEVGDVLPEGSGIEVTISIPGGEQVARRTLNPRLGIIGGLSVLGTTGIVEPMSEEAFKRSLVPQIDLARAQGYEHLVLTPGRMGAKAAERWGLPGDRVMMMSNFVGYILEECSCRGIKKVLLLGHHGKLVKVAAGIFNTHNRVGDARIETIVAFAAIRGANRELLSQLMAQATAEGTVDLLRSHGLEGVFHDLACRASRRAEEYVTGAMQVGTIMYSLGGEILGYDEQALEIGGSLGWHIRLR